MVAIFCQCVEKNFHVKENSLLLCLDYLSPQRAGLQWEKGFLGRGYEQRRTWTLEIYFPKICSDLALDFETVSIYLLLQGFPLFRVNYWVEALIHFFRCMESNVILTMRNWWWIICHNTNIKKSTLIFLWIIPKRLSTDMWYLTALTRFSRV